MWRAETTACRILSDKGLEPPWKKKNPSAGLLAALTLKEVPAGELYTGSLQSRTASPQKTAQN